MGKMSREKGKRGEREVANFIREYGYDTRRGQQYCGASGDADVVGLPGIYIEVKFKEKLNMDEALEKAAAESHPDEYPVVFHKKNYEKLKVTMRTQDLIDWTTQVYFPLPDHNKATFLATEFMDIYKYVEGR